MIKAPPAADLGARYPAGVMSMPQQDDSLWTSRFYLASQLLAPGPAAPLCHNARPCCVAVLLLQDCSSSHALPVPCNKCIPARQRLMGCR